MRRENKNKKIHKDTHHPSVLAWPSPPLNLRGHATHTDKENQPYRLTHILKGQETYKTTQRLRKEDEEFRGKRKLKRKVKEEKKIKGNRETVSRKYERRHAKGRINRKLRVKCRRENAQSM